MAAPLPGAPSTDSLPTTNSAPKIGSTSPTTNTRTLTPNDSVSAMRAARLLATARSTLRAPRCLLLRGVNGDGGRRERDCNGCVQRHGGIRPGLSLALVTVTFIGLEVWSKNAVS